MQEENDLKAAEARLATAMGLPGETAFALSEEPLPAALPDRINDLIDAAIQNRPELKDLRLEHNAAERLISRIDDQLLEHTPYDEDPPAT